MEFDTIIKNLPVLGIFFEKTYAYWQRHIAVANLTHVILGTGLGLLVFSKRKKLGVLLIAAAAAMHLAAFFGFENLLIITK